VQPGKSIGWRTGWLTRTRTLTWTVSRHRDEIGPGDTVFLWETGPNRGIRAVMRVNEAPRVMAELESEQAYWAERGHRGAFGA